MSAGIAALLVAACTAASPSTVPWSIGLFRLNGAGAVELYAALTIDRSGQITGRRFP